MTNTPTDESLISELLQLDFDEFNSRFSDQQIQDALFRLDISIEDLVKRYWRKTWLPKLLELFKREVEEGNKGARLFVGEIVTAFKDVPPPEWLIKAWYYHDAGFIKNKPRSGNGELFKERVKIATLYVLIQRRRDRDKDKKSIRTSTTQALVEEFAKSTSKVDKDKQFIERITTRIKDWPDSFIYQFTELVNVDLEKLDEFLGVRN